MRGILIDAHGLPRHANTLVAAMRVLAVGNMYPPHHLGGYEVAWRGAMGYLRGRGHEIRILTSDFRRPGSARSVPEEDDVHRTLRWYWRDHAFPRLGARERLGIERHNRRELLRQVEDFRPDAVNWWAMGGMSLAMIELARRRGLPAVGVVGDDWMDYGMRADAWQRALGRRPALRRPVEWLTRVPATVDLDRAATWIFVSETARRRARAAGWALPRSRVQPNGIDRALFPQAPEDEWAWHLLYVGRVEPRKGVGVAVEALSHLPDAARLAVVGAAEGGYLDELRARARALGAADRLTFREAAHEEIAAEYAGADVTLFPSLWEEPFGLVPLEAMSVGRPVVASGRGGSGEYLRDGVNCLLYEPADDSGALAAAIRKLADDPELRRRLRAGGFSTAEDFDEESFAAAIEEALGDAVRATKP